MKKLALTVIAIIALSASCSKKVSMWDGSYWIAMNQDKANTMDSTLKYFHGQAPDDPVWADLGKYQLPEFRKDFTCSGEIEKAEINVCGVGQFDLFLNGKKVDNHFMDPAWTQYDQEVCYVTFDVKDLLLENNAVGVMLGGGFYNIPNERYHKIVGSMGAPKMRFVMDITYKGGKTERICSDSTWKVSPSPITFSSIYGGEDYDATKRQEGWNKFGFDDSKWQNAIVSSFNPLMIPEVNDPLTVHSLLQPVSVTKNEKGLLYDMGQNFSGIFRITLTGERGTTVKITPSELIRDGMPNQSSGGGPCYYNYTLIGDSLETWQPQFTYYGQRYFQVEGIAEENIKEFIGLHTCASSKKVGKFECSNTLFNQILSMTDWALRNNMASVLTDCPHREKLGWDEQLHLMFVANEFSYNLSNIYQNELDRMSTAQRADGCVPTIAPEYVRFNSGFEDSPEWGSSMILVPWYIYRWYGDSTAMIKHYPAMKRYISYLGSKKNQNGVVAYGLRDWLRMGPVDSEGVTSHLIYVHCLNIISKIARAQGFNEDAEIFDTERTKAINDFNSAFWHDGIYDNDNQTVNSMALYMGAVPEENRDKVYANLLNGIKEREYAISVGEVAHPFLLEVLREHGDDEIIYKIHTQRKAPGYAWCVDKGATALPEAWDGGLSQTHFCLGHIVQWFYGDLAGLRQAENSCGWKKVIIDPRPVGDVTWVKCSFDSPSGVIESNWTLNGRKFVLSVTAPKGIDVQVRLPEGYDASYTIERK